MQILIVSHAVRVTSYWSLGAFRLQERQEEGVCTRDRRKYLKLLKARYIDREMHERSTLLEENRQYTCA